MFRFCKQKKAERNADLAIDLLDGMFEPSMCGSAVCLTTTAHFAETGSVVVDYTRKDSNLGRSESIDIASEYDIIDMGDERMDDEELVDISGTILHTGGVTTALDQADAAPCGVRCCSPAENHGRWVLEQTKRHGISNTATEINKVGNETKHTENHIAIGYPSTIPHSCSVTAAINRMTAVSIESCSSSSEPIKRRLRSATGSARRNPRRTIYTKAKLSTVGEESERPNDCIAAAYATTTIDISSLTAALSDQICGPPIGVQSGLTGDMSHDLDRCCSNKPAHF